MRTSYVKLALLAFIASVGMCFAQGVGNPGKPDKPLKRGPIASPRATSGPTQSATTRSDTIGLAAAWDALAKDLRLEDIQDPAKRAAALRTALERHAGGPLAATLTLALARAEYDAGDKRAATARVQTLIDDTKSFSFDPPAFSSHGGFAPHKVEKAVREAVLAHYRAAPNLACDEALSQLAAWQGAEGEWPEAWKTEARLVARYPDGDRVKEDAAFLTALHKEIPAFPARFVTLDAPKVGPNLGQFLDAMRRPHMAVLLNQAIDSKDPETRARMRATPTEGALATLRLLDLYPAVLSTAEYKDFAESALHLLAEVPPGEWNGPRPLEETRETLKATLKAAREATAKPL